MVLLKHRNECKTSPTCSDQGSADALRASPMQKSGDVSISTPVGLAEAQKTHLVTKDTSLWSWWTSQLCQDWVCPTRDQSVSTKLFDSRTFCYSSCDIIRGKHCTQLCISIKVYYFSSFICCWLTVHSLCTTFRKSYTSPNPPHGISALHVSPTVPTLIQRGDNFPRSMLYKSSSSEIREKVIPHETTHWNDSLDTACSGNSYSSWYPHPDILSSNCKSTFHFHWVFLWARYR